MRILFIDNYDSFTYNVVELLRQFDVALTILKNDELDNVVIAKFDKLIISPGPDLPSAANGLMTFLNYHLEHIPTLGICLGHQAIAECFGAELQQYADPKHGEKCQLDILVEGTLFQNLPQHFEVGLYHSWYVSEQNLPTELFITAKNNEGIIMAMQHAILPIYAVQFHPESFMSEFGTEILHNFIFS